MSVLMGPAAFLSVRRRGHLTLCWYGFNHSPEAYDIDVGSARGHRHSCRTAAARHGSILPRRSPRRRTFGAIAVIVPPARSWRVSCSAHGHAVLDETARPRTRHAIAVMEE